MKVLFIGGTGTISSAVSKLAVTRDINLVLFNRGNNSALVPKGVRVIVGDIHNPESRAILRQHHFDVVVNWVAFTPDQVQNDIDTFENYTDQYIFISSASVYQKPIGHYLVTESTPLKNPYWRYARQKIEAEQLLMDRYRNTGFPVTIVRPSHTYGDATIPASLNSHKLPWSIIDRMQRKKPIIVHGDGSSLWTVTHNTDFALAFLGLLGQPSSFGHAFHITSDEVLTWNQIHQMIGHAAGIQPHLMHIASDFIAEVIPTRAGGLLGDKVHSVVFDNTKIKRWVPGYRATVSFAEGIRRTLQWFEAHPDQRLLDAEWDAEMDRVISAYTKV